MFLSVCYSLTRHVLRPRSCRIQIPYRSRFGTLSQYKRYNSPVVPLDIRPRPSRSPSFRPFLPSFYLSRSGTPRRSRIIPKPQNQFPDPLDNLPHCTRLKTKVSCETESIPDDESKSVLYYHPSHPVYPCSPV